jgi:sugar phosphate isomerase/epimerase
MILSLSTHLFVFHALDESTASLFYRFGFSEAEIWAMPPHFPYRNRSEADRIAGLFEKNGVRLQSLHAPIYPDVRTYKKDRWYSLSSTTEERRAASVEAAAAAARWLADRGGGNVILHTSFPAGDWYPERWAAFLSSMSELLDLVPDTVRFAVENTTLPSGTTDIVLDIVDRYPPERVGVCLDLGHAHMQGDVLRAIRDTARRLIHIHAHDNRGDRDNHLIPGRGTIPWKRVFAALNDAAFPGPFSIELSDRTQGDDAPYGSFEEMLADLRKALRRFSGGAL